jgi:hypothetical protein
MITWALCSVNIASKNRCNHIKQMFVCRASPSGDDTLRRAGHANSFSVGSHGQELAFYNSTDLQQKKQKNSVPEQLNNIKKVDSLAPCFVSKNMKRGKK